MNEINEHWTSILAETDDIHKRSLDLQKRLTDIYDNQERIQLLYDEYYTLKTTLMNSKSVIQLEALDHYGSIFDAITTGCLSNRDSVLRLDNSICTAKTKYDLFKERSNKIVSMHEKAVISCKMKKGELDSAKLKLDDVAADYRELVNEIEEAKEIGRIAQEAAKNRQEAIDSANIQQTKLTESLRELDCLKQSLRENKETLERSVLEMEGEYRAALSNKTKIEDLVSIIESVCDLEERITVNNAECKQQRMRYEDMTTKLDTLQSKLIEKKSKYSAAVDERNKLNSLLEDKKTQESVLDDKQSSIIEVMSHLESESNRKMKVEELERELEKIDARIKVDEQERDTLARTAKSKRVKVQSLSGQYNELVQLLACKVDVLQELEQAKEQLTKLTDEEQHLRTTINDAKMCQDNMNREHANKLIDVLQPMNIQTDVNSGTSEIESELTRSCRNVEERNAELREELHNLKSKLTAQQQSHNALLTDIKMSHSTNVTQLIMMGRKQTGRV